MDGSAASNCCWAAASAVPVRVAVVMKAISRSGRPPPCGGGPWMRNRPPRGQRKRPTDHPMGGDRPGQWEGNETIGYPIIA
jgi:hypothetical protein